MAKKDKKQKEEKKEEKKTTPKRKKKTTQPTEDNAVMVNGIDPKTGQKKVREIKTKKVIAVWPVDANALIQSGEYEAVE